MRDGRRGISESESRDGRRAVLVCATVANQRALILQRLRQGNPTASVDGIRCSARKRCNICPTQPRHNWRSKGHVLCRSGARPASYSEFLVNQIRESTRGTIYGQPVIAVVAISFAWPICPFAGKVRDTVMFEVSKYLSRSTHSSTAHCIRRATQPKDHHRAANGLPRTIV